jgi:hypothetical protein
VSHPPDFPAARCASSKTPATLRDLLQRPATSGDDRRTAKLESLNKQREDRDQELLELVECVVFLAGLIQAGIAVSETLNPEE